jgi:hypothetical protein
VPQDVPRGSVAWLRATVARFSRGEDHARRRGLAVRELAAVAPEVLRDKAFRRTRELLTDGVDVMAVIARPVPVGVLAEELGLSDVSADVAIVAAAYHPHVVPDMDAEAALGRLIDACGEADEFTAARIGLLIQACDATAGLIGNAISPFLQGESSAEQVLREVLVTDPPVRVTRRRVGGQDIVADLLGTPFGAGAKECPGRTHALALAAGVLEALRGYRVLGEISYAPSGYLRIPAVLCVTRVNFVGEVW